MEELEGKMILEKPLKKIKCDYKLVRRNSFSNTLKERFVPNTLLTSLFPYRAKT